LGKTRKVETLQIAERFSSQASEKKLNPNSTMNRTFENNRDSTFYLGKPKSVMNQTR
jgi:hypothetical protein